MKHPAGTLPTLTRKQKQVLDYIQRFVEDQGYVPSYGEIARGLGLSSQSTICVHVENLQKKGYLTKKWNANRSIDFSRGRTSEHQAEDLPLVGRIAAGLPIEAVQDTESIAVPAELLRGRETYVLQVKGDSMTDAHVLNGDYVIVTRQEWARDGDMVVALIRNSEATLKRFRRRGNKIVLEPANPVHKPQVYDESDVSIQGIVVGLLRKYEG